MVTVAWLLALVWAAAGFAQPGAATHFREGIRLHQSGQAAKAVAEYRACLKLRPEWTEARSNLGAALSSLGRYEAAAVEYRLALKQAPGNQDVRRNLALAYYKAARIPEAIAELNQLRPSPQVTLLLADCHFRLGDNKTVIRLLESSERSSDPAVAYLLGSALIREGQAARGQVLIEGLLGKGESAEVHLMMGNALLQAGRYEEAAGEFTRSGELNPKLETWRSMRGLALLGAREVDGARREFEAELAANPNDFDAHFKLGVMLKENRQFEAALPHLVRAAALRPAEAKAALQVGVVQLAVGRPNEARIVLEKLVGNVPGFPEAHATLAIAYYRLKRKADGDRHRDMERQLRETTTP